MRCIDCEYAEKGWFKHKPEEYVCIGVKEPFIIESPKDFSCSAGREKHQSISQAEDFAFAVKDREGYYYTGYKQWDKQIRKAKLYHSYKYAKAVMDDVRFIERDTFIVRVRIMELDECNYDD